jgi:hypothetical protein
MLKEGVSSADCISSDSRMIGKQESVKVRI